MYVSKQLRGGRIAGWLIHIFWVYTIIDFKNVMKPSLFKNFFVKKKRN